MTTPTSRRAAIRNRLGPSATLAAALIACACVWPDSVRAQAQQAPAKNAAVVGKPADFTGIWKKRNFGFVPPYMRATRGQPTVVVDGLNSAILKPWTAEIIMEKLIADKESIIPYPHTACWLDGVPGVLGLVDQQVIQTPTEMIFLYHTDNQFRHVYLDRPHSASIRPSWYGESVGHFEGDTLVVDTVGFVSGKPQAMVDRYGTPVTSSLHVVERYRLLDAGKGMQIQLTVDDPTIFRKSWSMTIAFERETLAFEEGRCAENNRDHPDLIPIADKPDF